MKNRKCFVETGLTASSDELLSGPFSVAVSPVPKNQGSSRDDLTGGHIRKLNL